MGQLSAPFPVMSRLQLRLDELGLMVMGNNIPALEQALNEGFDVNTLTDDEGSETLLMTAAYNGKIETLQFLIDSKACLDIENGYGYTALAYAQGGGHGCFTKCPALTFTKCVELLIAVIEPRFQPVFNFTDVYPAVQLNHSC